MDEPVWPMFDNSSGLSSTFSSTSQLPTVSLYPARSPLSPAVVRTVGQVVSSIGIIANTVVLAVLVRARKHAGSNVHTLIANQSAMDLVACTTGLIGSAVRLTTKLEYKGDPVVDGILCVIFEGVYLLIRPVSYTHLTLPTIYSV